MASRPSPLFVDVGNTSIAAGMFPPASEPAQRSSWCGEASFSARWPSVEGVDWQGLPTQPLTWVVATVNRDVSDTLHREVMQRRPHDQWQALGSESFPVKTSVFEKRRVGADRLAAVIAADAIREPHRAAVVVDAGSAINVELLSETGVYRGGAILPGMAMSAAALASGTDLLPVVSPADAPPRPCGRDTNEAIRSGLYWGAWGGITEIVRQFAADCQHPPHVYLTGGGVLWRGLDAAFEYRPNLVLSGIAIAWAQCADASFGADRTQPTVDNPRGRGND